MTTLITATKETTRTREAVPESVKFQSSTLKGKDSAHNWQKVKANALLNRVSQVEKRKPCAGSLLNFFPDDNGCLLVWVGEPRWPLGGQKNLGRLSMSLATFRRIIHARTKLSQRKVAFRVS